MGPASLSRRLGCGRRFLTQTQLPNWAGRTASLLFRLRFKPSKSIIIRLAPPTALLLLGATHHSLRAPEERGWLGAGRREGFRGSLSQRARGKEEQGRNLQRWVRNGSRGGKEALVTRNLSLESSSVNPGGEEPALQRAGIPWVWPCCAPEKRWGLR